MKKTKLNERWVSEKKVWKMFLKLFPNGLTSKEIFKALIPNGLKNSTFVLCYHPTDEIYYRQHIECTKNTSHLDVLCSEKLNEPVKPKPILDYETVIKENKPTRIQTKLEMAQILGDCIWDVFSGNNEVFSNNGWIYHLGSWRGTGSFLSDYIKKFDSLHFDYMNFYMGTQGMNVYPKEVEFEKIYLYIFKLLKKNKLDWAIDDDEDPREANTLKMIKSYYDVYGKYPKNTTEKDIRRLQLYYKLFRTKQLLK